MLNLLRRKETAFLAVALALGLLGLVFAYFAAPTRLTVAVGPKGSADEILMQAFGRQLAQQHTSVRLSTVSVPDVREAAQTLERNHADLAVVRPDVAIPENGLTLAILREAAIIVVAPKTAKVTAMTALAGKRLGVVPSHEADPRLIETLLKHYDLDGPAVNLVTLAADRVVAALKAGQIDAVAFVAPPDGTIANDLVRSIMRAYDGKAVFVPVDEADAIAGRSPALGAMTIPAGTWGGRPKNPGEDLKTLGVSYRLMARSDIDRSTISVVTQYLFQMRSRLSVATRSANLMKAPENDTSTSAPLPNHPGAVDYFQREQQNFMERYSDWIYLLAFFGSGLASALAWIRQRFLRQRREEIDDVLDRLLGILADARAADTAVRLDELSSETDALLSMAVDHARNGATDSRATSALMLAIDGARSAISDRRRDVERLRIVARREEIESRREGPARLTGAT